MNDLNHSLTLAPRFFGAVILFALAGIAASALADVHYVDVNSPTATPPYTNWTTAATNIQEAVDAAVAGDEIVVTNGIYAAGGRATVGDSTTNRVAVDKPLSLRSINGPQSTTIDGSGSVRGVYLTDGASLSGFNMTNGFAAHGAGLWCQSTNAVVSNCVVSGNSALISTPDSPPAGGGVYGGTLNNCILSGNRAFESTDAGPNTGFGGGAMNATLNDCTLNGNGAGLRGGGACNSVLNNCALSGNGARDGGGTYGSTLNNCSLNGNGGGLGGGANSCTLNNCTLTTNSVSGNIQSQDPLAGFGGGAYACTLNNCILLSNSAHRCIFCADFEYDGGPYGSGGGAFSSTLNNCALSGNYAGTGGGAAGGTLNNCTLMGNSASDVYLYGGGVVANAALNNCTLTGNYGGGAIGCALKNCIAYFNFGPNYDSASTLNYCCTTPQPTSGTGNITNAPLFVDTNGWANLRLQSSSPCVNTGNNAFVTSGTDLDGRPRVAGGTVDIGAYEFQSDVSGMFIGWLQQYSLPTDGSADSTDPDGDGLDNWQEWRSGTDPTNALSVLRLLAPVTTGTNVTVSWQSAAGVSYFLERATSLLASPAFTPLATNLLGQPGTTTYTDTNSIGVGSFFYRVGVQ